MTTDDAREQVRRALADVVRREGRAVLLDARRTRAMLADLVPAARAEIAAITAVLELGVAARVERGEDRTAVAQDVAAQLAPPHAWALEAVLEQFGGCPGTAAGAALRPTVGPTPAATVLPSEPPTRPATHVPHVAAPPTRVDPGTPGTPGTPASPPAAPPPGSWPPPPPAPGTGAPPTVLAAAPAGALPPSAPPTAPRRRRTALIVAGAATVALVVALVLVLLLRDSGGEDDDRAATTAAEASGRTTDTTDTTDPADPATATTVTPATTTPPTTTVAATAAPTTALPTTAAPTTPTTAAAPTTTVTPEQLFPQLAAIYPAIIQPDCSMDIMVCGFETGAGYTSIVFGADTAEATASYANYLSTTYAGLQGAWVGGDGVVRGTLVLYEDEGSRLMWTFDAYGLRWYGQVYWPTSDRAAMLDWWTSVSGGRPQ